MEPTPKKSKNETTLSPSTGDFSLHSSIEPGREIRGIEVFVGTTGTGKTYLAWSQIKRLRTRGMPGLVIDSAGAENFRDLPHCKSLQDIVKSLERQAKDRKEPLAYWTPPNGEALDQFFSAILSNAESGHGFPLAIMIDEISYWTVEYRSKPLRKACRLWRHWQGTLFITSQHVSADLGQVMQACNPLFYLFKTTSSRSLRWIEVELEIPRKSVKAIPERNWIEMRV